MISKKVALLVISCDKYSDLWPIYFGCLFKYWPNCPLKIYLGANYKTFDHQDVTMINIGADSDYSSNLIAMLSEIEEDYVFTTVEDIFICAMVDEPHLFDYFEEFFDNKATYLKLAYTFPVAYDKNMSRKTASIPKNVRYRLGMGASLWDKKKLLRNLISGMSAWEMERGGEFGKNIPEKDVYAINYHFPGKTPFEYVHGVAKGAWLRGAIPWIKKEGYEELLSERMIVSLPRTFYIALFAFLMKIFIKIRYRWKP